MGKYRHPSTSTWWLSSTITIICWNTFYLRKFKQV
ncbi:hypothetical protein NC653_041552 [Populus alba x Populus x berolinensis]|uniref:Uncharacterized protein n=1 Tax=Populus alba x Populus x berolinensis TaxID=444605 RepID=A0AAD6PQ52_9ROSI|nr:hypothetical protein NC653_041552 [Populus alba x Populus x berolinensis]